MTWMTRRALAAGVLLAPTAARAQPPADWKVPGDAEIRAILARRIDEERRGVGIVVGIVGPQGRRIVAHGSTRRAGGHPVDARTVYEIGSMTKVLTSLLLAEAVRRGEVALDDPVAKHLPTGVRMPERGGRQITLVDLATHTSALPRMPANFAPKDPTNPYADYDAGKMYAFLDGLTLTRDIGSKFEYSNLGVGLLGHVLARRAGVDYPTLVRQRITTPLGMNDTATTLPPALQSRLAQGHNAMLEPVANWDIDALAGAGGLRSTADDMLTFLSAQLGFTPTPLRASMDSQLLTRRPADGGMQMALGWVVRPVAGRDVIWHNGGTGGYRTFMGFDPRARAGCVVLTNTSIPVGGDDIGFHILAGLPVARLTPPPVEISLPAGRLAPYVGVYEGEPGLSLTVTQDGGQLSVQMTGQNALKIYPSAADEFFLKVVDAQLGFRMGADGSAMIVELRQLGRTSLWRRKAP